MLCYYSEPEQTQAFFRAGNGWGLMGAMPASGKQMGGCKRI